MCGSVVSVVSATPLKKRHSLNEPLGPPSPLAPLSETTTTMRVVELPGGLEVVEDATDLVVGVRDEAGEHLGHAGEQSLLVAGERVPRTHGVEHRPGLAVGPVRSGSPCGLIGDSSVSSGSRPSSFCRARIPARIAS